jgi:hypothetical protein
VLTIRWTPLLIVLSRPHDGPSAHSTARSASRTAYEDGGGTVKSDVLPLHSVAY